MVTSIIKSYISHHNYNIQDNIYLFQQYFIPSNETRKKEIIECLRKNSSINEITKIYLLNERIYTKDELGLNDKQMKKIEQINIGHRLIYNDIFNFVREKHIKGYIIFSNSDIFLDDSVKNVYKTPLASEKTFMAQLRFEYNKNNKYLQQSKLFTEYLTCSQDTWIYHTNYNPDNNQIFNFEFGKPGCDNKIIYLMNIIGYNIINDPYLIKTYHNHMSQDRNYTQKDAIPAPYLRCYPILPKICNLQLSESEESYIKLSDNCSRYGLINENDILYNYINDCIKQNKQFIIPRIAGVENDVAYIGSQFENIKVDINNIQQLIYTMKNNAGINISSINSFKKYANEYIKSFKNCEYYFEWDKWGNVYRFYAQSHDYINNTISKSKNKIWAVALDIFHSIKYVPWTHSLKGKKILIVSAFEKSITGKINSGNLNKIYGIDLFPDCSFVTIKPPQTQASNNSMEWDEELSCFYKELDIKIDMCDIALVSAGGYGNLICDYIYSKGKSAIYVGGVLQMYFGILGSRWERERPEILQLYMNKYWSRPEDIEKPENYKNVEGSCYW